MKRIIQSYLFLFFCFLSFAQAQKLLLYDLVVDDKANPIGIGNTAPRFSWKIKSHDRGVRQAFYEIRVSSQPGDIQRSKNLIWQSGKVKSEQSIYVPYNGPALKSRERFYWQVRVWDSRGHASGWSEVAYWEMGLLNTSDWSAKWIEAAEVTDGKQGPVPVFSKKFHVSSKIRSARLYITSHGVYDASINGQRVTEDLFNPGWTSYQKRLQYQAYDVTSLLRSGENNTLVSVGDGWYRGNLEWRKQRNFYGKEAAILYQLEVQLTNGEVFVLQSDGSWQSTMDGPIRFSDIYNGELIDTRIHHSPEHTKRWDAVREVNHDKTNLIAQEGVTVTKHEHIKPTQITKKDNGDILVDFGQNIVGWVKLDIAGNAGDTISLHHAEVLNKDNDLYLDNLRSAKQLNQYVLNGQRQTIEPSFTFQGFRYVRISGYHGDLSPDHMTAIAIYSNMPQTGKFTSSNALINQLQQNIQWGQKGNFLDIPTDCPQRDERLGWTGDAQVFFRTAAFNMDVNLFFKKWLGDVRADQYENGNIPVVIPKTTKRGTDGSAGWSDVITIVPWQHFMQYGDTSILRDNYQSMKRWLDFVETESQDDLWKRSVHYGDWLFYTMADDRDGKSAITDKGLIAQAFYAASTHNLIRTAQVLGKDEDVVKYTENLVRIKRAFVKEFVTPSGRLVSGSQTAYVLALHFDLLPEEWRAQAAQRLVDNIKEYKYHITTGFLGTPYINTVLSRFGHGDTALKLLLQETYPSWLYPVKSGATTIWERWDGIKPDGSFQTASMNSFNHYAYGAVGEWMYAELAGIQLGDKPGYQEIVIAPRVKGPFSFVSGRLETPYGSVVSGWEVKDNRLVLKVSIPANTTAKIILPQSSQVKVTESGRDILSVQDIQTTTSPEGTLCYVGSGDYVFSYVLNEK